MSGIPLVDRADGFRGRTAILATEGREALALLAESSVDLAIVDHFLPGMTGCECVRAIREMEPPDRRTSIIVVSIGGEEIKERAMESGADLFLEKPVLCKELIDTAGMLLSRSSIE